MKKTYIVVASSIMLLFCLAYQSAYAYFSTTSQIEDNFNTNINSGAVSDLIITDGNHVTSNNIIPGESVTNTFTVQNPNNLKVCFNLLWSDVVNEFINKEDLGVTLIDQSGRVLIDNQSFPSTNDEVLAENLSIEGSTTNSYTLTITYKNSDQNQIADMGKTFSGTITGMPVTCQPTVADKIIAQLDTTGACPTVNDDGTVQVTRAESANGYLCSAPDDYGTSYYYRGNVTNNYVKFGKNEQGQDMYWRIIRINGDDSIRMIYDGTSAHANGESSEDRRIGESEYNSNYSSLSYVGYMYGDTSSSAGFEENHANINNSVVKNYLDNWYENTFLGQEEANYISDTLFCNDRDILLTSIYYSESLTLQCSRQSDRFTVEDKITGNGALVYPIGLITNDEVFAAGGYTTTNTNFYLYTGFNFWTLTPYDDTERYANVHFVNSLGRSGNYSYVTNLSGIRPVINLKADSLKFGDGTANNPYRVTE